MRALIRYGNNAKEFRVEEVPEPKVGPGLVKIKVAYAGICGTDIHMYTGDFDMPFPMIPGHELSGTVVEVGEGVGDFAPGDRVIAEHTFEVCGKCSECRAGKYHLCNERYSIGFERGGAFAEYVLANSFFMHKLPDNISLAEGAMTEPLACAVHAVEFLRPLPGDNTLVVGPGPIGLLTALTLKAFNCQVAIVGTPEDGLRLSKAGEIGIKVLESNAIVTNSFDAVLECSGSQGGVKTSLNAVRKGGKFIQVGISGKPIQVDTDLVVFKELSLHGTFCHHWPTWVRTLELEKMGLIDVKPLISEELPLEKWPEAFEKLVARDAIKILFSL